jgi:hypothetical protein
MVVAHRLAGRTGLAAPRLAGGLNGGLNRRVRNDSPGSD